MQTELERLARAVEELAAALESLPATEAFSQAELKILVGVEIALDRRAAVVARREFEI